MKKLLIASATLLTITGTMSYMANKPTAKADDVPPIVQEVTRHKEELDNHEARISNVESDVKDLQKNTSTAPSSTKQSVPQVTTQSVPTEQLAAQPTQTSQEVKVVSSSFTIDVQGNHYCSLVYSDGSTGQAPENGTTKTYTDENGQTHTSYDDHCRDYIGQTKK